MRSAIDLPDDIETLKRLVLERDAVLASRELEIERLKLRERLLSTRRGLSGLLMRCGGAI